MKSTCVSQWFARVAGERLRAVGRLSFRWWRVPVFPLLLGLWGAGGRLSAQHQTAVLDEPAVGGLLPYEIELREVSLAPAALPNLHSMAVAVWEGQWVLLAGRTNGLHGMTGMNAFDPQYENREVWVIDPVARASWRKSLVESSPASGLGADLVDALSSANTQFHQSGAALVVVGGYGYKRSAADHKTYDTLTVIDLPGLVGWVKQPPGGETSMAAQHIRHVNDPYLQVTGGSLEKIGGEYQLVMGQNYDGRYRPFFNGIYTRQVRRFTFDEAAVPLVVPPGSMLATPPLAEYRRRDLNVMTVLEAGSVVGAYVERVVALSGVFTIDGGAWTVPVVVGPGGVVTMADPLAASSLRQGFQVYHCAKAGLYQRATGEMHMLLFGGITILERDPVSGAFIRDDQIPFTNQCGVVVRRADGSFRQFFLPARFPRITSAEGKELRFGANADFFPAAGVPMMHPKVIDLARLRGETVIGHIFGGLVADAANGGATGASGRVFEVVLRVLDAAPALAIALPGGEVELSWQGLADHCYRVERSEDLTLWSEVSDPLAGPGPLSWSEARTATACFYRVLSGSLSREPAP